MVEFLIITFLGLSFFIGTHYVLVLLHHLGLIDYEDAELK